MPANRNCIVLDDKGMLFAKGTLLSYGVSESIVGIEPKYHRLALTKVDSMVSVRTHAASEGLLDCRGRVAKLEDDMLFLTDCVIDTHAEKREDIKLPVGRDVFFIACGEDSKGAEKFSVLLRDISAGGIGIATDYPLTEEGSYEIVFDLSTEPDVFPVIMVYKGKTTEKMVPYGFRFAGLHPLQESQVREYVFKKHLEMFSVRQIP
ncbi:MAG: PilZ domain-containing protein [Oscillospiraceae bacterium]|nr:PilZ domain-containing protein [Oscillospiraceae bacterium]